MTIKFQLGTVACVAPHYVDCTNLFLVNMSLVGLLGHSMATGTKVSLGAIGHLSLGHPEAASKSVLQLTTPTNANVPPGV